MRRPIDSRALILCALAGCGGGSSALPAGMDSGADLGPIAVANDGSLDTAPPVDAGPADAAGPDAAPADTAAMSCLLNADCPNPLACAFGRCRPYCLEAGDCPAGQRCVRTPGADVCLLPAEDHCARNADCPSGLVCAPDLRCRSQCKQTSDCHRGEPICADELCAAPGEVTNGHLGGGADAGTDATMLWGLSRGMNRYRVTAVSNVNDGCAIEPQALLQLTLPVNYDVATMVISIGDFKGSPPMPALGSGRVASNMALLSRENQEGDGLCSYHRKDLGYFRLFDHDRFTLDVTEELSQFTPNCQDVPAGGHCLSSWQWSFVKAD
jgi:hypothetical protein